MNEHKVEALRDSGVQHQIMLIQSVLSSKVRIAKPMVDTKAPKVHPHVVKKLKKQQVVQSASFHRWYGLSSSILSYTSWNGKETPSSIETITHFCATCKKPWKGAVLWTIRTPTLITGATDN